VAPDVAFAGDAGVTGVLVDLITARPLLGRTVVIGGQSVTTDADGQFAVPAVDVPYQALVVEPDGLAVSVYEGLTRRDPVLAHQGTAIREYGATVQGDVSGGGVEYPLSDGNMVDVRFFSAATDGESLIGGTLPSAQTGPAYGPIQLAWEGFGTLSGEIVALGTFHDGAAPNLPDSGSSSWFFSSLVTLDSAQTLSLNVALSPVPFVRHVVGAVGVPPGYEVVAKQLAYRFPVLHALLALPVTSAVDSFDDIVPELTEAGADLCIGAAGSPGSFLTQRCGLTPSDDAGVVLEAPPTITAPSAEAAVDAGVTFAWSAFTTGIYALELSPAAPSRSEPTLYVFTAAAAATWPNLAAIGVSAPQGGTYRCSVEGFGPYSSMDDAFGPDGIGAPYPAEIRRSVSPAIQLSVVP